MYAALKIQQNAPLQQYSRFVDWFPTTRYELLKFFAVVILMGFDRTFVFFKAAC